MPKILIAAPVRDRAWVLDYYLEALDKLDYPEEDLYFYFLINDSTDDSEGIITDFAIDRGRYHITFDSKTFNHIKDERTHNVRMQIYSSLAKIRNMILDEAIRQDVDYLFSVDSDIIVPPEALKQLVNDNKDIVAAQIWNDPSKRFPNILIKNGSHIQHYFEFPKNQLFRCHTTGAVYLLSKKAFSNLRYEFNAQGEDVGFCNQAEAKGIEVWADSKVFANHIMSPQMLEEYKKSLGT